MNSAESLQKMSWQSMHLYVHIGSMTKNWIRFFAINNSIFFTIQYYILIVHIFNVPIHCFAVILWINQSNLWFCHWTSIIVPLPIKRKQAHFPKIFHFIVISKILPEPPHTHLQFTLIFCSCEQLLYFPCALHHGTMYTNSTFIKKQIRKRFLILKYSVRQTCVSM